jgi:membrane-associated phospholipid phosphatase
MTRGGALWLKRLADAAALFMKGAIPFTLISLSFAVYSTLAVRFRLPLRDAELATLDAFIGFNWLQFLRFVNSSKIASGILVFAYHSFVPQFVFLVAVLSFMRMGERISEFVNLYAVTALITAIVATIVPAAGAHAYFAPSSEQFSNFTSLSGMWHHDALVKLRTAKIMSFDPFQLEGMVTFPSFHAAAAILIAYAVRGIRFIGTAMLALNVVMILSTVPEGGHYLVDVVAGILIAIVCIAVRARIFESSDRQLPFLRSIARGSRFNGVAKRIAMKNPMNTPFQ